MAAAPQKSFPRLIGFVGLGKMGMGMARNLLSAGYDVLAYDVVPQILDQFVSFGGRKALNPAQIGAECQSVMVMVVNGAQVDTVINGPEGLMQTMTSGTVMVCSTLTLNDFREIVRRSSCKGVAVIDTPVSGGVGGAEKATLSVLCGGEKAVLDSQMPILKVIGKQIHHLGPAGSGLVGKLANNLIIGIERIAISEAMALAKKAGVPLDVLYEAMKGSSADSFVLRTMEGPILTGKYPNVPSHAIKDIRAALESAQSVKQAMPLTSLAAEVYQLADEKLGGLKHSNEILRFFLE